MKTEKAAWAQVGSGNLRSLARRKKGKTAEIQTMWAETSKFPDFPGRGDRQVEQWKD
jgi:hypothetical protein